MASYVSGAAGEDSASSKWMKDVTIAKKYGYQLIIKEYGKNPGQAKKLVRNVGQAQSGTILQSGLAQMEKNMISSGSVYVVENEMVFTYLIHNLGNRQYTLLCTSGQPRSAVQLLLPMILKSGAQIYYSGDIDPDGIRIADRLWQKFGDGFHIWRMEAEDYEKSCSNEVIGTVGIRKLENIHHPQLKLTAEAVKKKEKAG